MTQDQRAALRREHDGPNDCGAYIEFLEGQVIEARGKEAVHCHKCKFFQDSDCQHDKSPVMFPRPDFGCVWGEKKSL